MNKQQAVEKARTSKSERKKHTGLEGETRMPRVLF
jgi:hypothetical protein